MLIYTEFFGSRNCIDLYFIDIKLSKNKDNVSVRISFYYERSTAPIKINKFNH